MVNDSPQAAPARDTTAKIKAEFVAELDALEAVMRTGSRTTVIHMALAEGMRVLRARYDIDPTG